MPSEERNAQFYNKVAKELEALQAPKNAERGIHCVRSVVATLRSASRFLEEGNEAAAEQEIRGAKQICHTDHDKMWDHADIVRFLVWKLFLPVEIHPWGGRYGSYDNNGDLIEFDELYEELDIDDEQDDYL